MARDVAKQIRSRRRFRRIDGTYIELDDGPDDPGPAVRSRRAKPQSRLPFGRALSKLGSFLTSLTVKFDLALGVICALLVAGVIFFGFGMAGWLFFDADVAWTYWLLGLGFWAIALGIFFLFMNDPYPRHGRKR